MTIVKILRSARAIAIIVIVFAHLDRPYSLLGQGSETFKGDPIKSRDVRETAPSVRPNDEGVASWLRRLASEQIVIDGEFLGKTRFRIDSQARTLYYDLNPIPLKFVVGANDPYAEPLEAFIRVESLRRDFSATVPNDEFWDAPLRSIDDVAEQCARGQGPVKLATSGQPSCSTRLEQEFDRLREAVLKFTSARQLTPIAPTQDRGPAPGYLVQIKIDPPRARIRIMPLLEYKKYQYFKAPKDEYRWLDVLEPEIEMIGWYRYRAEWPEELHGPEEGDICIKKPVTITFSPPQR